MNIILIAVIAILALTVIIAFFVLRQPQGTQIEELRSRMTAAEEDSERSTFSQRVPAPTGGTSTSGDEGPRILRWSDQPDTEEPPTETADRT